MSQYTASVPSDGQVKPEIRSFFEKFYEISDTPNAHEKYAEQLTKDGQLIMGPNESNGRESESELDLLKTICPFNRPTSVVTISNELVPDILKTRKGMWEKVAKRSHNPIQIYAFGSESDDIMLHGTVDYVSISMENTVR